MTNREIEVLKDQVNLLLDCRFQSTREIVVDRIIKILDSLKQPEEKELTEIPPCS